MNSAKWHFTWRALNVIVVMYLFIMAALFHVSTETIVKFVLLHIMSIFLPGMAVLSLVNIQLSRCGYFCISYLVGYVVLVVEYFCSSLLGGSAMFSVVTIGVAAVSFAILVFCYKKKGLIFSYKGTDCEKTEVAVLAISLFLNVFAYSANYLGPDVISVFSAFRDMQYWANNSVALMLAWPADNLFMAGEPLNYHYFSNIPIAFLSAVYGIDIFSLSFPLYSITKAVVMVGAVQFLLDSMCASRKVSILVYFIVLYTTGVEKIACVTYVHHTLLSPFGFDIGYAYGILFVAFLVRQWNAAAFQGGLFFGALMSWGMCVGAKAPVAAVLILFAGLICMYWLAKKRWALAIGYGGMILCLFLLICKFCVGMFSVASGEASWSLGIYRAAAIKEILAPEAWDLLGQGLAALGRKNTFLACFIRILSVNPVVIVASGLSVMAMIRWKRKQIVSREEMRLYISLGVTAFFGVALGLFVNAGGHSEMYFSMAALIPMFVMVLLVLKKWKVDHQSLPIMKKSLAYKFYLYLLIFLACIGGYRYGFSAWLGTGAIRAAWNGTANIYRSICHDELSQQADKGIRKTDVEALHWLRENADKKAIVMTDKAVLSNNAGYYLYGIFCERQQYLEGTNMLGVRRKRANEEAYRRKRVIRSVYNNEKGAIEIAIQEGIDYIVRTKDIAPDFVCDQEWLELVKSTETMDVYKVKRKQRIGEHQ